MAPEETMSLVLDALVLGMSLHIAQTKHDKVLLATNEITTSPLPRLWQNDWILTHGRSPFCSRAEFIHHAAVLYNLPSCSPDLWEVAVILVIFHGWRSCQTIVLWMLADGARGTGIASKTWG